MSHQKTLYNIFFNNVFINPSELVMQFEQEASEKLKSSMDFSYIYKKFAFTDNNGNLIRDKLPEINTAWLKNNLNAENALNLSSIKKWQGKTFPSANADWLRANLKILGSDFIESVEEWSGINTRRELDAENVFDSHCVDYETLGVDFVEDNKSEDYGNWNFNQLGMF